MRALIAPDAFKGAASAVAVADALAEGLRDAWPGVEIDARPLSDGGEGLLAVVAAARRGEERVTPTTGPHGEPLFAGYWRAESEPIAVVEVARAAGLSVTARRDPLKATSAGVAPLILAAVEGGARRIELGAGGSATVDGGAGLLMGLGYALRDARGREIPFGGEGLRQLTSITPPAQDPLKGATLRLLSDVTNPLLGPLGAAAVYGPQKGADVAAIAALEAGLERLAAVLFDTFGRDPRGLAGGGAAGGLVGGLWAVLGAEVTPGFEAIAELVGLDEALMSADLVLTGEGRVDEQTCHGKTVGRLLSRTGDRPTWIFAGEITAAGEAAFGGRAALIPIVDAPMSLAAAMAATRPLLRRAASRAARRWGGGQTRA
ncbi:glycerate kinase [Myxococcota bacterium]|nr:glycerate kinase [Myxococcota bacterium]